MLKELSAALALSVIVASPSFAMAKDGCSGDCTSCHSMTTKEAGTLLGKIGVNVKSVKQSPARGLYEVLVEKDNKQGLVFIDYGKKHLLQGIVVNLETMEQVSAHAQDLPQPKSLTTLDVATIPADKAVVIGNPKGSKKLYVFTDPDCPYCRKLHVELKKLEKIAPDVAIYVMLYPLAMHPQAFDKARSVIETKAHELLDKAFEGKEVPAPAKESSRKEIEAIVKFAGEQGISGTPTMVLGDGKVVVGMRDAETLKKMLDGK